ncbi:hypothetical protein JST99_02505 [Candidatus Dependentiae bacterium]|nr:hypothetical protein [Candidatus Dependentiae bacterium]MCC7414536.1 hypothetical protein [Campylobacterota bacterium]
MNGIEQCFKKPTLLSILSWSRYSIFSLLFLVPAAHGYTFFSPRSQTVNAARELVGWQQFINIPAHDRCSYSTFSATPEYTQSFKENQLAEYFFGCPTRIFSGSQVSARGEHDILADYFGLPTDFQSSVTFKPRVQNALLDLDWYQSLDNLWSGAYIRVHAPLVYAAWEMNMCESIEQPGTNAYPAGYMASSAVERSVLESSVTNAFCRKQTVGDMQPLTAGRICCSKRTRTNVAEVQVALGHNPILCDTHHFGWNIRTSIPTGCRSRGDFLFEPMIGNGGHWELGAGLTGHVTAWSSACENHAVALYSDLNVTHLFTARQRRSFDFTANGCLSRYMLLEQMSAPLVSGLEVNRGAPIVEVPVQNQYSGKLIPAVNVTTLWANISVDAQVDFVIKAAYTYKNCTVDIGYDLWFRSKEKMGCREQFPNNAYALKGDTQLYGFALDNPSVFVALNGTQHAATIQGGQAPGNSDFTNDNVDNPGPATFNSLPLFTPTATVNGSAQAILLTDADLNNTSGLAPRALSQMLFFHAGYDWHTCNGTNPFVGVGASVEWGNRTDHVTTALSQWGVWLKIGFNR